MLQSKPLVEKREIKILKPMFDRLLLEILPPPERAGITAASNAEAGAVRLARVLAIGPGKLIAESNRYIKTGAVEVGDLVYINPLGGNKVTIPEDYDFVVEGAGPFGAVDFRCNFSESNELVMTPEGQHLLLNRKPHKVGYGYQLQTEDGIWMSIGKPGDPERKPAENNQKGSTSIVEVGLDGNVSINPRSKV